MIDRTTIEIAMRVVASVAAFLPAIGFAGYFQAWVAREMGDSTGQDAGFLTVNPAVHIDPFGLMLLVVTTIFSRNGFGWWHMVPINQSHFHGVRGRLRLAIALYSSVFAHFMLAILGTIAVALVISGILYSPLSGVGVAESVFFRAIVHIAAEFVRLNTSLTGISLFMATLYFFIARPRKNADPVIDILIAILSVVAYAKLSGFLCHGIEFILHKISFGVQWVWRFIFVW